MGRWRGREKLERRLKALTSARAEKLLFAVLEEGGEMVASHAKKLISTGSASGQSGGKHQHIRSHPGQPPNEEWGDLGDGIEVTPQPKDLVVEVSANAPHSVPLELGTSKMAARPFLRPARDAKRKEVRKRFADQASRVMRGAAD